MIFYTLKLQLHSLKGIISGFNDRGYPGQSLEGRPPKKTADECNSKPPQLLTYLESLLLGLLQVGCNLTKLYTHTHQGQSRDAQTIGITLNAIKVGKV